MLQTMPRASRRPDNPACVRTTLRMMEEADVRAPALKRHLQGLAGHVPSFTALTAHPTMNRRDPRSQDRREVQFAAAADDEDRSCRRPTADSGRPPRRRSSRFAASRLVVIAHGGYFVTLPGPGDQAFFLHQGRPVCDSPARPARSGLRECAGCHSAVCSRQRHAWPRTFNRRSSRDRADSGRRMPRVDPAACDRETSRHRMMPVCLAFSTAMNRNLTGSASRRRPSLFLRCRAPRRGCDSPCAAEPAPPARRSSDRYGPAAVGARPLDPLPQGRFGKIQLAGDGADRLPLFQHQPDRPSFGTRH